MTAHLKEKAVSAEPADPTELDRPLEGAALALAARHRDLKQHIADCTEQLAEIEHQLTETLGQGRFVAPNGGPTVTNRFTRRFSEKLARTMLTPETYESFLVTKPPVFSTTRAKDELPPYVYARCQQVSDTMKAVVT